MVISDRKTLSKYSYILILSKNTTYIYIYIYIYQQIDNILEFWQHVSAVKKPSSGQNRTLSRYSEGVHLNIVLFWPDDGFYSRNMLPKF